MPPGLTARPQKNEENAASCPETIPGRSRCRRLRKNLTSLSVISVVQSRGYSRIKAIFLDFGPVFRYHNGMVKFYYETWLPFVFNKRRILLLAIASYIALC